MTTTPITFHWGRLRPSGQTSQLIVAAAVLGLIATTSACSRPSTSEANLSPPRIALTVAASAPSVSSQAKQQPSTGDTPLPVEPAAAVAATRSEIDRAALAGVQHLEAADTRIDHTPRDTLQRAGRWLTPRFLERVRVGPAGSSATWTVWVAHRAHVQVSVALGHDDHPPDTTDQAYRQVIADLAPTGARGWRPAPSTVVVFTTLRRSAAGWRIDSLHTTAALP